jgi:nucleoside-diphosphate-sugar epimerase
MAPTNHPAFLPYNSATLQLCNSAKGEIMMRVVIIGGTGHVGTYLVPRLVEAGFEVICVSRQQHQPYQPQGAWQAVRPVQIDRATAEQSGEFGAQIRALEPDVVIDMICFTPESARHLVEALRGQVQHFLHCGTIWVHGPSMEVPTTEMQPRRPFGDYGVNKAAIEEYLLAEARRHGFPATILHPGHIVGPGWAPLNPAGHFDPQVFVQLARGEEVALPNFGLETVHHVHADDVAQIFMQAIAHRSCAVGESFHVVSPAALTLRGYAEGMAAWFGQPARLRFLPWEEWRTTVTADQARATWDHIAHSPNCSIAKAQRLLDYRPRYSSLQAVQESVRWLMEHGVIEV